MLTDPFVNNWWCCGKRTLTDVERIISEYYKLAFNCIQPVSNYNYAMEIYGNVEVNVNGYDKINDYHYLLAYLLFIYNEIKYNAQLNQCGQVDIAYYIEKYNIECIKKHFLCLNCKPNTINAILQLFELDPNVSVQSQTGIGYMAINPIDPNCPNIPPFTIF